jgi:hypothetical protein
MQSLQTEEEWALKFQFKLSALHRASTFMPAHATANSTKGTSIVVVTVDHQGGKRKASSLDEFVESTGQALRNWT